MSNSSSRFICNLSYLSDCPITYLLAVLSSKQSFMCHSLYKSNFFLNQQCYIMLFVYKIVLKGFRKHYNL